MFKGFPKVGRDTEEEETSLIDDLSLSNDSGDLDIKGIVYNAINTGHTQNMQHHRPSLGESVSSYDGSEASFVSKSSTTSSTTSRSSSRFSKQKGKLAKSRRRLSLIFGGPGTGTIKEGKQQNMPLMRLFNSKGDKSSHF